MGDHVPHAFHDVQVRADRQRHGSDVKLRELRHEISQAQLSTVTDLLEGFGGSLLHLLDSITHMIGLPRWRRDNQNRNHVQGRPQKLRSRPHPLPHAAHQFNRCLLRVLKHVSFCRIFRHHLRNQSWKALNQVPHHAVRANVRARSHVCEAEKVSFLRRDPSILTLLKPSQNVFQSAVRGDDLDAIIGQIEQIRPVCEHIIV
mmetsp:Transcript_37603/g.99987  ORF Transcript_37603/g.99987 Transcript_37603/m.99987 type:complete len:202 (+) Transcript_37603:1279-1884(+)